MHSQTMRALVYANYQGKKIYFQNLKDQSCQKPQNKPQIKLLINNATFASFTLMNLASVLINGNNFIAESWWD